MGYFCSPCVVSFFILYDQMRLFATMAAVVLVAGPPSALGVWSVNEQGGGEIFACLLVKVPRDSLFSVMIRYNRTWHNKSFSKST